MALNHFGNSKWLQTSPIKNEINEEERSMDNVQSSVQKGNDKLI